MEDIPLETAVALAGAIPEEAAAPFSKARFAYDSVRRKILDGAYQPGDRLRLSELARQLGLSEMPVREALRLLQKDGLIVMRLHRGAEVARLSFRRGLEVTEARMSLERRAVLSALPYHDAASLRDLARWLAELERATTRPEVFALKNRAFCTALFARCPNGYMRQLIEDLWDQIWQASSTSVFAVMRHRVPETIEENRAILQHTRDRDRRKLGAAMEARQRNTLRAWQGAIADQESARNGAV